MGILDGTALQGASSNGHIEIVKLLLAAGADVNKQNWQKYTPLHLASNYGYLEIVKLLLVAGAEVNTATGSSSLTALDLSLKNGHDDVAQVLRAAGGMTADDRDHNAVN
ncbi:ankyrin repeat-containing domain protein [Kalaharituber pfeilii]|nr:ankyrin repeat-containing domain protein [Kalaharituber pfeilii]